VTAKVKLEQNIFDLTAYESAQLSVPHSVLLIKAFEAIARENLPARFDAHPSPVALAVPTGGKWWLAQIKQAIFALEQNPHFFVRWFRLVMVDLGDYACWRNTTSKVPPTPRPKRMSRKELQQLMDNYLRSESAKGRKGSQKRAWDHAKAHAPGRCSYPEVIKALAKAEGGKKARGRPRTNSIDQKSA
jgi:hypothetical protein